MSGTLPQSPVFLRFGFRFLAVVFCLSGLYPILHADTLPRIQWAGVSFAGDAAQVQQVYPHTYAIYEKRDLITHDSPFEKKMRELLGSASFSSFTLAILGPTSELDDGNLTVAQGQKLALTLAIDGEHIEVEELGNVFAIRIWLSAQLLVFDFEGAEILTCYPVGVMLSSASRESPTHEHIENLVHQGIFGDTTGDFVGLLAEASKMAAMIRPQDSSRPKVQLAKVGIEGRVLPFLPSGLKDNQRPLKYFIANSFAKSVSAETGIPVLPYVADSAIGSESELARTGGTMTVLMRTVRDARVLQMKIPMPDYIFTVNLQGFKKALASKKPGLEKWIFGAYVKVTLLEPESRSVYLDQSIVNPWFEDIPEGTNISEWSAYQKSLHQLLRRLAENLNSEPNREWLKGQSGKALRDQLKVAATKLQISH